METHFYYPFPIRSYFFPGISFCKFNNGPPQVAWTITLIHIMALKVDIVITVFETSRRQIRILNTKYYEYAFEKSRVREINIMITKLSKTNSK